MRINGIADNEELFSMFIEDVKKVQGFEKLKFLQSNLAKGGIAFIWGSLFASLTMFAYFISYWFPNLFADNLFSYLSSICITLFWFFVVYFVLKQSRYYFNFLKNNLIFTCILGVVIFTFIWGLNIGYLYRGLESNIIFQIGTLLILLLITVFHSVRKSIDVDKFVLKNTHKKEKKYDKILGYFFRVSAIVIWGVSPLIVKYSLSEVSPLLVTGFSIYIGLLFVVPFFLLLQYLGKVKKVTKKEISTGYTRYFWTAVLFDGLTIFLFFFSVQYTLASNAILVLNFAPVVGLMAGIFFFRNTVAYLQTKGQRLRVIIIFIIGCLGTSFLVLNQPETNVVDPQNKLFGDFLSVLALICDVIATIAIILYAKSKEAFSGLHFIVRKVCFLAILFSPIVLPQIFSLSLTSQEWMSFLFLGVFNIVLSYYFAYEAYKRMEGLIAYLMFNLTAVITVFIEVFVFGLALNILFIFGAVLIISSTIFAEIINTKAEREVAKIEVK